MRRDRLSFGRSPFYWLRGVGMGEFRRVVNRDEARAQPPAFRAGMKLTMSISIRITASPYPSGEGRLVEAR